VLVVDYSQETCDLLELLLGDGLGIEVAVVKATRPEEALRHLEAGGFDLMLSDINLEASLDGLDLLRAAKQKGIETILLTGFVSLLFADLLWRTGWSASRTLLLSLFVILFLLAAIGSMHGVYGFFIRIFGSQRRITGLKPYKNQSIEGVSTAIIFPIYNEDSVRVLEGLRARSDESRLGIARSVRSLALLLDKSIEVIEVGVDGGMRCRAEAVGPGHRTVVSSHVGMASASFAPEDLPDEMIDAVSSWSTIAFDRYRLSDRLRDLRSSPWGEADGEGALLRLAAAKAAVERLVVATPEISVREMPDILIAAGGIWASTPPSVVALAMADLVRRPGVGRIACDQARLLGPLGAIADEEERRKMLKDLVEDVLLPVGSLILPAGIRLGRSAGRMRPLTCSASGVR